jgi:cysteate synthase
MKDSKKQIEETYASVLTNLTPPYGIKGGLYDALVDTDGVMYAITRKEVLEAKVLFESLEGIHTASIRGCCRFPVKSCKNRKYWDRGYHSPKYCRWGVHAAKRGLHTFSDLPVAHAKNPDVPLEYLNI